MEAQESASLFVPIHRKIAHMAKPTKTNSGKLVFRPLTAKTWPDMEVLFGSRGACGGCWCMTWRLARSEFEKNKGEKNRRALRKIASSGAPVGMLAYTTKQAVGWCSIAPRDQFPALGRSRVLRPVDEQPVWSVTCFFVAREYRRSGVTPLLLRAAVAYVKKYGAKIVEGYPTEPSSENMPAVFAWTGFASAFREAGFEEVARRSANRPIMRSST